MADPHLWKLTFDLPSNEFEVEQKESSILQTYQQQYNPKMYHRCSILFYFQSKHSIFVFNFNTERQWWIITIVTLCYTSCVVVCDKEFFLVLCMCSSMPNYLCQNDSTEFLQYYLCYKILWYKGFSCSLKSCGWFMDMVKMHDWKILSEIYNLLLVCWGTSQWQK